MCLGIGKHGDQEAEKRRGLALSFPTALQRPFHWLLPTLALFSTITGWNVRALLVSQWRKLEAGDLGREMGDTAEKSEPACVGSHTELSILQDKTRLSLLWVDFSSISSTVNGNTSKVMVWKLSHCLAFVEAQT